MMLLMVAMDRRLNMLAKLVDTLFGCPHMMYEVIGKPEALVDNSRLHLMPVHAAVDKFEEHFDKFELQLMAVIANMCYSWFCN